MAAARSDPRPSVDKVESELWGRIRAAFLHAKLTQSKLEAKLREGGILGPSKGYLSKLRYGERGAKKGPSPQIIEGIADVCGVDFHWLFTGRGSMLPPHTPPMPGGRTISPPSRVTSRG